MKNDDFPLLNQMCEKFFKNEDTLFISYNILPLAFGVLMKKIE